MKGYITGTVCLLLAYLMWPSHPFLAAVILLPLPIVVLAFWTGAIGVRFNKGNSSPVA